MAETGGYRPFIDDPAHLAQLRGQRFVVLRVSGPVYEEYRRIEEEVRRHLQGLPISHPAQPHVTLVGLAAETSEEQVRDLTTDWASDVAPLDLRVQRVCVFPAPFQIVVAEVPRTPALARALSTLRGEAARRGLRELSGIPPADWTFHLSVAYCSELTADDWDRVCEWAGALTFTAVHEVVTEVEIVTFGEGVEISLGVASLTGGGTSSVG